jgi:uncharacterized FlgJ-related protein
MFYTFNNNTLNFDKDNNKVTLIIISSIIITSIVWFSFILFNANNITYITEETKAIIIKENDKKNEFSETKLREYILELNIKFPHIVLAQSQLETGHYTSKIFKENNNLFGMKEAKQRPTTNKGTENDHAYYDNWKESVQDYAMYSARYLNQIKTQEEYLQYLSQNYAEDQNYVTKLKLIIDKNNTINNSK